MTAPAYHQDPGPDQPFMSHLVKLTYLLRRMVPEAAAANLSDDALHQLDTLCEHFDDAGLQPDLDEGNLEVALVPCPYYHLLSENQSLVCNVHERLIHDLLAFPRVAPCFNQNSPSTTS